MIFFCVSCKNRIAYKATTIHIPRRHMALLVKLWGFFFVSIFGDRVDRLGLRTSTKRASGG